MCGRYSITSPVEALARLFRFAGPLPNLPPRYNVAPTQQVPIVRRAPANGERELAQVRRGLMSFWAKVAKIGAIMISARAQGTAGKQACCAGLQLRHCLLLADRFYQWHAASGRMFLWRITLADGERVLFVGLRERWDSRELRSAASTSPQPGASLHPIEPLMRRFVRRRQNVSSRLGRFGPPAKGDERGRRFVIVREH